MWTETTGPRAPVGQDLKPKQFTEAEMKKNHLQEVNHTVLHMLYMICGLHTEFSDLQSNKLHFKLNECQKTELEFRSVWIFGLKNLQKSLNGFWCYLFILSLFSTGSVPLFVLTLVKHLLQFCHIFLSERKSSGTCLSGLLNKMTLNKCLFSVPHELVAHMSQHLKFGIVFRQPSDPKQINFTWN